MTRLPSLTPKHVVTALGKADFAVVRIRGSHYQLFNPKTKRHVTVPHHNRDLPRGTVAAILNQAGISRDEFLKLL